jgi:23S rRNA pseudouridine1911/1915/1917 synthase
MKNDSSKIQQTFIIPDRFVNERLDQSLAKLMPDYSRTQIQDWIAAGAVLVNGQPAKSKTKLKGGEVVSIEVTLKQEIHWQPQVIPLNILYEDADLLVVNKPVGLVVHPGAGNADHTLLNALLYHSPQLQALPRAGILHRLDKDTSGLLVIAKTPAAFKNLTQQLKKRSLRREYQALVYGTLISGGTIEAPIGRHPIKRKRMAVIDTGKLALTHYRLMGNYRAHARVKIQLETGRTHQIRVHMAHIHHPIIGDSTYDGRVRLSKGMTPQLIQALRTFRRQALHAFALTFHHPTSRELIHFETELPDDMQQLIKLLRIDIERDKK